jgi:hypothetical protein
VKINELKPQQLEEGFLDNFISRVKDMAGGDGPTGVIRSLMGQAPNLNKLADTIANNARSAVLTRLGNQVNFIKNGSAPTPIGLIYQQALASAGKIANGEDDVKFNPAQVKSTVAGKQGELLKIVLNGDAASDANVKEIYQAIISNEPELKIANDINATIKTVSMIVASALVYISTQEQDKEGTTFDVDTNIANDFKKTGDEIIRMIAVPTSPELRSLKPDNNYKETMLDAIARLLVAFKGYSGESADKLEAMVANTPDIISGNEIHSILAGHNNAADTEAVANIANRLMPMFKELTKDFVTSAAAETKVRNNASNTYDALAKPWGTAIFQALDNLKFAETQPAQGNAEIGDEEKQELEKLNASHDAGTKAVTDAFDKNKDLKPEQMKNIYNNAREDYDLKNPL